MKQCTKCHRVLPENEFYVRRSTNSLQSQCKDCCKAHGRLRNGTTGIYKKENIMQMNLGNGLTVSYELITPQIASNYLESNIHNRKIKNSILSRYVYDMTNGNWTFDGSPIKFSKNGVLLDGQHRLQAIVNSNVTLPFLTIRGLDDKSQDVMDTGAKRTAGDVFQLRGKSNAANYAAIIKTYIIIKSKSIYWLERTDRKGFSSQARASGRDLSNSEIWNEYQKRISYYDEIVQTSVFLSSKSFALMPPSYIGGIISFLIFDRGYSIEYCKTFFEQILGIENVTNKTCRLMYEKLMKRKSVKDYHINGRDFDILIKKTFNNFVTGKEVSILKVLESDNNVDFISNTSLINKDVF